MNAGISGPQFRVPIQVIKEAIEKRWCLACYLIINWRIRDLVERAQWEVPKEFYSEVAQHLYAYVYEDKMPPEQIAQTIMNVAEDFISGKPVQFRAGDYIAVQNYVRSRK